jgi:Tat protein secretion system quality control protein TatD with DNase activity
MYVKILAEEIARIKEISLEEVTSATTNNAKDFFHLE